ncbi:nitroreductase family deazaflavin-dependent oxidoreductase [Gordonia malaquae]|jgi:deazaflavin-dependent oxidoreductase (nitroreductase family)|uniref:nitroreductase family deazaflavin-dependent oxidoreductase n=1 Tax=Gordonia TaxID=2053 RepID=UPI0030C78FAF
MTDLDTAAITAPLTLPSGQTLANRLMKSALSEGLADGDGSPDDRLVRLYSRWADGGFGLVVTGNVMVDRRQLGEPGNVVIEDESHLAEFARWADAAKRGGSRVWMQVNHPGRQANPLLGASYTVAPSAIGMNLPGIPTPRALTGDEIVDLIERFATAARVAETAGFDGVQIHGAHGYLVSQFLSPLSNQRTDEWGGSVETRARFLLEIIRAIRSGVRPDFGVGVKLNSADFQRGGFTEDDSRAVISLITNEQIDMIEISGGSYESPAMMGRPVQSDQTRAREAYFLEYADTVRELAGDIPLAVTGGFRSREAMADAVDGGHCDLVGLGRPTTITPDAARRIIDGIADVLPSRTVQLPLPSSVRTAASQAKTIEGALDLQWHADQLRRMGDGNEPDPQRAIWRTAVGAVRHNGLDAFRSRRGGAASADAKALRKFRFERAVGRRLMNPTVAFAQRLGFGGRLATHLETTGRKSGETRVVPVSAVFDDEGAWVISQHGTRSGWALNVLADPSVRIRQGDEWRTGTATVVHDDDVRARARTFAPHPALAGVTAATFQAMESDPVSVRIVFDRDID